MNLKIRKVKLKKTKFAIQVFVIENRKRRILKHIGSGIESELINLFDEAKTWIDLYHNQYGLFQKTETQNFEEKFEYNKTTITYAYEFLGKLWSKFKFDTDAIIKDLCLVQILEPSSKRHKGTLKTQ